MVAENPRELADAVSDGRFESALHASSVYDQAPRISTALLFGTWQSPVQRTGAPIVARSRLSIQDSCPERCAPSAATVLRTCMHTRTLDRLSSPVGKCEVEYLVYVRVPSG